MGAIKDVPWFLDPDKPGARRRFAEWKSRKRRELDAALEALKEFNIGCAFVPDYQAFSQARDALRTLRRQMRRREWK